MDQTEKTVANSFADSGFSDVQYEPDGNQPPDFLIGGTVAVEVRRLNQNVSLREGHEGLERVAVPLGRKISDYVKTLGPSDPTESWFVFYDFRRPLPRWREIKSFLRKRLVGFGEGNRQVTEFSLGPNLDISLEPASRVWPTFFLLGGSSDRDSGGFVAGEMARNIELCIREKATKTRAFRKRYPEWWLALVDMTGFGLGTTQDRRDLESILPLTSAWDRVLLLNSDGSSAYGLWEGFGTQSNNSLRQTRPRARS